MNNILPDTNFLYALYSDKDSLHNKAYTQLDDLPSNYMFILPVNVYTELLCGVRSEKQLNKFIKGFTNSIKDVEAEDRFFVATIPFSKRKSLKANDCLILAIANRFNAKIITFDSKMNKIAKELNLLYENKKYNL